MSQRIQSSSQLFSTCQIVILLVLLGQACRGGLQRRQGEPSEYPDGYFPFEESPTRTPPKVRRPPYAQADVDCPGIDSPAAGDGGVQSLDNLCGDLNKGYIPKSPLGRNVNGHSYPFELIRNKTLDFFSSTLPILKADKNLPKLAKYEDFDVVDRNDQQMWKSKRNKRYTDEGSVTPEETEEKKDLRRQGRGLCDKNYGIICTILNLINGRFMSAINPQERIENPDLLPSNNYNNKNNNQIGEDPLTPCPSAAEYVTPVYAKNYQGVWRYVVQIPYEGYFTQTVEVTKCLKKKCHFMDGSCLASPRWVSLLVAELFYPHARFPSTKPGAASHRSMSKSVIGSLKSLIPPRVLPNLPPYIPRSLPIVQPETVEESTEHDQVPHEDVPNEEQIPNKEDVANEEELEQSSRSKRQSATDTSSTTKQTYCDGVDEIGCYQVRLYYDWLLVPGSCKCWKQDFFTKYGRK
ncbi:uncharacterized protein LOC130694846 isoform X2 [Daphnia carinata]|uniref:uncharacterized protein LOC130694846 isoform X2 n=1 Tax=Daphnia carinata TaxID=120202 RepID=UPI00257B7CB5|nr:uncharacterized protein LOC130694846 isoform X2 [Daphnia carinata]